MNLQFVTTIALPLVLILIMFGLGLSLTVEDFKRVMNFPRPVIVGLGCQLILLPAVAFGLCYLFQLPPAFAIGLVLLSASPGGATSNVFSHLTNGDVALNLTLTAINSALTAITLPLVTGLALQLFAEQDQSIGLQFSKMIEVFLVILVPVSIGMLVRAKKPVFALKMDRPVRGFSIFALIVIVIGAVTKEWSLLADNIGLIGWAVLSFNLLSLAVGYLVPKMMKISHDQAVAISFEIGIHNGTLALFVAISVLGSTQIAVPAAAYSVLMFFTAGIFSLLLRKSKNSGGALT
ncbi:MAG: bile acid:sodium symporter family protein [Bdellovibrionota bacterium]